MQKIKASNSQIEMTTRKWLHANGFRYITNDSRLPGKPDIVLPKYKTVVFVHGCFWHGHDQCKKAKRPATKTFFWDQKLDGNIKRDLENQKKLEMMGWKVIVVWSCELSSIDAAEKRLLYLIKQIQDPRQEL